MLNHSRSDDPMAEFPVSAVEEQRRRYRRKRTTRSLFISAISTLIIAAIIVAVLASSPGWKTTQETFFNWEYARQAIPAVLSVSSRPPTPISSAESPSSSSCT